MWHESRKPCRDGAEILAVPVVQSTGDHFTMQRKLGRISTAVLALMLAAGFGSAYAAPDQGGYGPQQDAPKDCKKDPNDPRCKTNK
jgi:hypothetical protein